MLAGTLLGLTACGAEAGMMITAVFDGPLSGGVPKGVEVYVTEDIADLSAYGLGSANNGGGSDGEEFTFPAGSASAGDYLYIASEEDGFTAFFGMAPHYTSGAMAINGDDAIELFHNGQVIDLFGDINVDGSGEPWDHVDGWAARIGRAGPSATFDLSDWQFSGANALDGALANASAASPVPLSGSGDGGDGGEPLPHQLQLISAIQGTPASQLGNAFGDTDVSPLIDQPVIVEAIVVGDFQDGDADAARDLSGFFLQEEASDEDGDPASSEGLFVYDRGVGADVQLGDRVRVHGTVSQYFGETQLGNVVAVEVLDSNQLDQVAVARITLPAAATSRAQSNSYQPDLEAWEGMLVRVDGNLTVTEQYQLDRFNEMRLVAGERPFQFTQRSAPDAAGLDAHLQALGARQIVYDDGLNVQNAPVEATDGLAGYRELTAPRMGDMVASPTGVLDYKWAGNAASGATWRLRSHIDGSNAFTSVNPRPLQAEGVGGNLSLASLNVLNFFTTLDDGNSTTALGHEPRGANSAAELERQLAKTVNAIVALDADLLGLVEIENHFDPSNDGSTAVEVLVNAINARLGEAVYDYVYPGSAFVGGDAIATALIYKPAVLRPAPGAQPALLTDAAAATLDAFAGHDFDADPIFEGEATNRVPLAASFEHIDSGEVLIVAVNHFKSKGSSGLEDTASPNYDQQDGAGFWNARRQLAARALTAWLDTAPTGVASENIALLGDFNAYAMEPPLQSLLQQGYVNVESPADYSYVFDGQVGTLDYILLSDALAQAMTGAHLWHINADEADALDYNLDYGRSAAYFDATTATRNSDHDPLLVGLQLDAASVSVTGILADLASAIRSGGITANSWASHIRLALFIGGLKVAEHLEQHGHQRALCRKLDWADRLSDGQSRPRDWIEGPAVGALNGQLRTLGARLGC
ncbi:ExeM/NucH family extracellular endonuclease [Parahaliea mediterranea]|uniref:ExeM/NucH family extracellular endonuclease n=1 Tax=Parahaliea mediterranea TaxID=651086 RepID=UPI000E2EDF90|nr:ExeM/NucH family extracellular endonuclease [Parahaliea mediterranea]